MDFILNSLVVCFFLFFVVFLFKLPGIIHFYSTKENIENQKEKEDFLNEKYLNAYPNGSIDVCRPRKKDEYWEIHIDPNPNFLRVGGGDNQTLIKVIFIKESYNKIKQEIQTDIDYKKETELVKETNWDDKGNIISTRKGKTQPWGIVWDEN